MTNVRPEARRVNTALTVSVVQTDSLAGYHVRKLRKKLEEECQIPHMPPGAPCATDCQQVVVNQNVALFLGGRKSQEKQDKQKPTREDRLCRSERHSFHSAMSEDRAKVIEQELRRVDALFRPRDTLKKGSGYLRREAEHL